MKRITLALMLACAFTVSASAQNPASTKNISAVIGTGNTFQSILAAGSRRSLTIENNNTNGDNCWVFLGAPGSATAAKSILLGPGGSYSRYYPYIPSDQISVTCATTSDTIYADWQ